MFDIRDDPTVKEFAARVFYHYSKYTHGEYELVTLYATKQERKEDCPLTKYHLNNLKSLFESSLMTVTNKFAWNDFSLYIIDLLIDYLTIEIPFDLNSIRISAMGGFMRFWNDDLNCKLSQMLHHSHWVTQAAIDNYKYLWLRYVFIDFEYHFKPALWTDIDEFTDKMFDKNQDKYITADYDCDYMIPQNIRIIHEIDLMNPKSESTKHSFFNQDYWGNVVARRICFKYNDLINWIDEPDSTLEKCKNIPINGYFLMRDLDAAKPNVNFLMNWGDNYPNEPPIITLQMKQKKKLLVDWDNYSFFAQKWNRHKHCVDALEFVLCHIVEPIGVNKV